jgi:hypothetical protein
VGSRLLGQGVPHASLFFHVLDGREIIDSEGAELASLMEARVEAIQLTGAILRDEGDTFWNGTDWQMNVTDASGQSGLKLHFSADERHRA